ncbi:MAG: NAD(P)-dependent oxidoreductase, partial [Deltaproteobacteria bacterium]|nr:NAD(P)-dependent oxidoreductase [Deltaproteobacteria bacterium]
MKVFITGVTGQLGRTLAKTLKKDHMIIGLARKYAADIEVDKLIIGDLEQPHTFVDEIAECEALILNAAVYRSSGVPIDEYFKVNCQSVNHIFAQLAKISHKVKKAIFISTNAVHDLNQGSPVSEISRFGPSDYYQYSKLLAENIFLDGIKTSGIQGVIIRPGMIWGDLDFRLKKIFNLAQLDPIPLIGNKNPWCHFITFSDL